LSFELRNIHPFRLISAHWSCRCKANQQAIVRRATRQGMANRFSGGKDNEWSSHVRRIVRLRPRVSARKTSKGGQLRERRFASPYEPDRCYISASSSSACVAPLRGVFQRGLEVQLEKFRAAA
jgi:hypothetical protein